MDAIFEVLVSIDESLEDIATSLRAIAEKG
jgi:hypothetical protein